MIPGEPAYEGLGKEQRHIALHDEYEKLVKKRECEVCNPPCGVCKEPCPCDNNHKAFRAMEFDLWLEQKTER